MNRWTRLTFVSLLLAGTVSCDQATKQLAISELRDGPVQSYLGGVFELGYAENPGAFLSLFGGLSPQLRYWLLTAAVGVMLFGMLAYLVASRRLGPLHSAGLALFAGGGLSNWIDRLLNEGRVVDFMVLGVGPVRTGVFNVADVAIMIGVAMFVLQPKRAAEPPSVPPQQPA